MEEKTLDIELKEKAGAPPLEDKRYTKKSKLKDENAFVATGMETDKNCQDAGENGVQGQNPEIEDVNMGTPSPKHQQGPSFRDMLVNNGNIPSEKEEEVILNEDDVAYYLNEGIPSISFSTRVRELLDLSMKYAVVVKLLGRRIRYSTLRDKLSYLWHTIGPYRLIDCSGDCFIVKFSNMQDYQMALLNGPWVIFGHYLSVHPWTRDFSPLDHSINQVIGWVRLPMLPIRYYHKQVVRAIGQMLGNVIRIDYNTETGERGRFARIAIVIDLSKPLISKVNVDDKMIFIEYEGLPTICFHYGLYGHLEEVCPKKRSTESPEMEVSEGSEKQPQVDIRERDTYGAWMHAPSRGRRFDKTPRQPPEADYLQSSRGGSSNRFNLLANIVDDPVDNASDLKHANVTTSNGDARATSSEKIEKSKQEKDVGKTQPKQQARGKATERRKITQASDLIFNSATYKTSQVKTALATTNHSVVSVQNLSDTFKEQSVPPNATPTKPKIGLSQASKESLHPKGPDKDTSTSGIHLPPNVNIKGINQRSKEPQAAPSHELVQALAMEMDQNQYEGPNAYMTRDRDGIYQEGPSPEY